MARGEWQYLSFKDIEKMQDQAEHFKRVCKCGHTQIIGKGRDYVVCGHCGKYIFRTDELEFKYRMKEKLIREKRKMK